MGPRRKVILSDNGKVPTDLYMVEGLMKLKDAGYELRIPNPEDVLDNITDEVAVVMVTEVDYRTGRRHDMRAIIEKAHAHGAVVVWDLAHSAGAIPVDVAVLDVDFAELKAEMARYMPLAMLIGLVILMQFVMAFGAWESAHGVAETLAQPIPARLLDTSTAPDERTSV